MNAIIYKMKKWMCRRMGNLKFGIYFSATENVILEKIYQQFSLALLHVDPSYLLLWSESFWFVFTEER